MIAAFVQLSAFGSDWKRLKLDDQALRELELLILSRPEAGKIMRGTGGLRKIRFAPSSWSGGKSGAIRVCYVWFREYELIYLFTAYEKNERDNISRGDANRFKQVLTAFEQYLRGLGKKGYTP